MNDIERIELSGWIAANAPTIAELGARDAYGPDAERAVNHFAVAYRQISSAFMLDEIGLYLDDLRWLVATTAAHRGDVGAQAILAIAAGSIAALTNAAPARFQPPLEALAARIRAVPDDLAKEPQPSFIDERIANVYFALCGAGERGTNRFVRRALELGLSRSAFYLDMIAPAQREAGRLWQQGRMTVEQEGTRTALSQRLMMALRPPPPADGASCGLLIGATAPGEEHQVGLQMVCDLAATDGWTTRCLPIGDSPDELVAAMVAERPDVIALSATMYANVGALVPLIGALHAEESLRGVKIIVGGAPFVRFPHLAAVIGADRTAADAAEALDLLRTLAPTLTIR